MLPPLSAEPFRWQDGERLVIFGRGAAVAAAAELGDGFALLTTERALAAAPAVAERAARVHLVRPGRVDEIAAELTREVQGELVVGLGGGRPIDVAKAVAAALGGGTWAGAVPTTLSGAEMTRVHRHAANAPPDTPRVRPAIVINDPLLSASQVPAELAASALNALGHAAEAPVTPLANPVSTLAALEAARLITGALLDPDVDRAALALGALLAGYSIDSAGYGLHHVLSQTLVRHAGMAHGAANAIMLPHTLSALAARFPGRIERLSEAMGGDARQVAGRLTSLTGSTRLREHGIARGTLAQCAQEAAGRFELGLTPPAADEAELLDLYEAAW